MQFQFKLPDVGEGVAEGEILKWMVKEGDKVVEDQPLVEVMTDKVNVQIPSPKAGVVSKILVKAGDTAKVGQVIIEMDVEGGGGIGTGTGTGTGSSAASPVTSQGAQGAKTTESQAASTAQQPAERVRQAAPAGLTAPSEEEVGGQQGGADRVMATPSTRRLARELGVELTKVKGTGPRGRITEEDVRAASGHMAGSVAMESGGSSRAVGTSADEELVPLKGIRKAIAERMTRSARSAAQVALFDEVDMTELVTLREAFKGSAEKRGVRLTYLPFIIKAVVPALKEFPYVNSTLDEQQGNIVLKKRYNIGIAVDTPQGLVVPVVKDADRKDIFELAGEMEKLSEKARANQLELDDVRGGTFTITNIGAIGGLYATPLMNYPEVAILGTYKITKRPVVRSGLVEVREMMNVSLSFDHRVVDGAYGARFVNKVVATLQDTKKLLAEVV